MRRIQTDEREARTANAAETLRECAHHDVNVVGVNVAVLADASARGACNQRQPKRRRLPSSSDGATLR